MRPSAAVALIHLRVPAGVLVLAAPQVVYTYSQGLQWCAQVADGLAFLHAQSPRIIHRDVKLDNVLLSDGASMAWSLRVWAPGCMHM